MLIRYRPRLYAQNERNQQIMFAITQSLPIIELGTGYQNQMEEDENSQLPFHMTRQLALKASSNPNQVAFA
jgi:hypothetical protein